MHLQVVRPLTKEDGNKKIQFASLVNETAFFQRIPAITKPSSQTVYTTLNTKIAPMLWRQLIEQRIAHA
jgi:hypothetical protein